MSNVAIEDIVIADNEVKDLLGFLEQPGVVITHKYADNDYTYLTCNTNQRFKVATSKIDSKTELDVFVFPQLVEDYKLFDKLDIWVMKQIELAVDTETDGLTRFRKCLGVSFSDGTQHFYIPLLKFNKELNQLVNYWPPYFQQRAESYIRKWLKDPKKKWIGHNLVFDAITLDNAFGYNIIDNAYSDTALLHHTCISEDPPHALKVLAAEFIDPLAADAQEDLKNSVIANGGIWKKDEKQFYKGDVPILAKYAALDPYYTMKLHQLWYGEIEKQGLQKLWNEEVLPLTKVMYQLNTTGLHIDVPYFQNLKKESTELIAKLEQEIVDCAADEIEAYEWKTIQEDIKITTRSEIGKILMQSGFYDDTTFDVAGGKEIIVDWYKTKHGITRIFNLGSKDDLAFLLYDLLKLPIMKTTKTGSPSTSKAALDELLEDLPEGNPILDKIKQRSKEMKLLNTYIIPLLDNHIEGKVYPQFNQIGTSSGRFTSGEPINFQTLPRDDHRIKKGFNAGPGMKIVNADFASLEPKVFAHMSQEDEIKRVYREGLELYSHVHKIVMEDDAVSAKPGDANFLKIINPEARQAAKVYTLAFTYGMTEYKYASTMGVTPEEGLIIKNKYFKAFPNLKKYQESMHRQIETKFYVDNLVGRRRRAKLLPLIKRLYPSADCHKRWDLNRIYEKIQPHPEFIKISDFLKRKGKVIRDAKDFNYAVKSEYNNSTNAPIQGTAASIANASCIEFLEMVEAEGLNARLCLQLHDEVTAIASEDHAARAAELLQIAMEKNKVARLLTVEMKAEPIIADNLAEAK